MEDMGEGPWVPTNIDGCVLWLRSDLGITKDGSNRVSLWTDQSEAGNDASQDTDSKKPVWTTNQINGHPSLVWDNTDDQLTNATFDGTPPITLFIVGKHVDDANNHYFMDDNTYGNYRAVANAAAVHRYVVYAGVLLATGQSYITSDYHYLTYTLNGANSEIFVNGVSGVSGNMGSNYADGYVLGDHKNGSASLNGHLVELIAYNSVLSTENQQTAEAYLATRYGL